NHVDDQSIQGYASGFTFKPRDTVEFKINTPGAATYPVQLKYNIYRLGWYGGDQYGATRVNQTPDLMASNNVQLPPKVDDMTGLVDCDYDAQHTWTTCASWPVPYEDGLNTRDATSGVYLAKFTRQDTMVSNHIIFVVRDDTYDHNILLKTSDATWQAYNGW